MKSLTEIDKNFVIESDLGRTDIRFFDVKKRPEFLFGIRGDEHFCRMPDVFAESVNEYIAGSNRNTAGGRIRFRTNSPFVAISVKTPKTNIMSHMAASGASGFDLFVDGRFAHAFLPHVSDVTAPYDRIAKFSKVDDWREREILIHFPLYNRVDEVYIGVQEDAWVAEAKPYAVERPVVFYGSSITQGGCVSRPGIAYPALIARWLDFDHVNLGFSGRAKGELCMAEYIASLDPSVFVMDYDHNTPNLEYLEATHAPFYQRFRELRPDTPVVMISAPDYHFAPGRYAPRRDLIRRNYEAAVAAGDDKLFFVDGETLLAGEDWDSFTVDTCHPNDIGHYLMAKGIAPAVKEALSMIGK